VFPYLCEKGSPDGLNVLNTSSLDESLEFVGLNPVRCVHIYSLAGSRGH
jgi:hypothetical protein